MKKRAKKTVTAERPMCLKGVEIRVGELEKRLDHAFSAIVELEKEAYDNRVPPKTLVVDKPQANVLFTNVSDEKPKQRDNEWDIYVSDSSIPSLVKHVGKKFLGFTYESCTHTNLLHVAMKFANSPCTPPTKSQQ